MDEDQGNTGVMRSEEEEENHREDLRKLVEMMQKEEEDSGAQWPQTWGLVAHTPRPCRSQKEKRYKGRDGLTVRTMKEREKK